MKNFSLLITGLLVLGVTAGCASIGAYDGSSLVAGSSTAAEVQAVMGDPAEKITVGGDTLWWYPRQSTVGRRSYAVVVGPNNVVKGVEQRLTEDNLKRIVVDKTTQQDLRALMGPPYYTLRYRGRDGDSWEYRMAPGHVDMWMVLSVRFDGSGVVKDVTYVADPIRQNLMRDNNDRRVP